MVDSIGSGLVNRLLNAIQTNRAGLKNSLAKIASGRRLGRAGEDPASMALSAQLQSEIRALSQAGRNVETGVNFVQSAEGGLSTISDLLARGRELAIQASNGTLNDSQRQTLNEEFSQIQTEIDRVTQSVEFNGQKLLDGSLGPQSSTRINIQAGSGSGPENRINLNVIEDTSTQALGIANADIATADAASQAFVDLGRAQDAVLASQGQVGAVANRLGIAANGIGLQIENLTRSESVLADTDLAKEISNLERTLTQVRLSVQTLANFNRENARATGRLLDFQG